MKTPRTEAQRTAALTAEVMKINRLLRKLWSDEGREALLIRRRSLLRLIHKIPQGAILPLDWQPASPHLTPPHSTKPPQNKRPRLGLTCATGAR